MNIREQIEKREQEILSPRACLSVQSRGRLREEAACEIRTAFQRDRDRIIHSKSFRRLKYKTQVFMRPTGDHYRTRLTHTLEVSQIARTVARALNLNEDLTEAISLGHDLGHTPFGHAGEDTLNDLMPEGFHHKEQSLRIVDYLEHEGQGLNLTWEVRDGIQHHSKGMGDIVSPDSEDMPSTLEGQVVRISDIIAYVNHDIDDALRAGIIQQNELPQEVLHILGKSHSSRINTMVTNIIETSLKSELENISLSPHIAEAIIKLRQFLYLRVYGNAYSQKEFQKTSKIISVLFDYFAKNPDKINSYKKPGDTPQRWACDFIAGMTDRYAIRTFQELYIPRPWSAIE